MADLGRFDAFPLGEPLTLSVERETIEPGRTFSDEALKALTAAMIEFVMTQVSKRWSETNEPPTALTVTLKCDVS